MSEKPDSKKAVLKYVVEYHKLGWCVIPIPYGTKKALIKWGRYQKSRPDEKQLRRWFANGRRNVAVVLGEVSGGLACRDFDTVGAYESWARNHPDLAATLPTVRTGKGYHVYFGAPVAGRKDVKGDSGEHLGELRGSGHYCMLPPSVHPDGPVYEWMNPPTDGNITALDPEHAGFLPLRTAFVTERTDENRRDSGGEVVVNEKIKETIWRTLPQGFGTRHRRIFEFARELYSMPEYTDADPGQFCAVVQVWHAKALPTIRTKEFEETWIDFLKGWKKIKCKIGEEPMARIFETAIQLEPPQIAVEKYPDNTKLKILVSLCRELQKAAGDSAFFLSVRTGAKLLNTYPMEVSRWLWLLETDGILKVVAKGGTAENPRKATRFRYLAN